MFPTPRSELEKAELNIGASINDFISRAVGKIRYSGIQWANQVDMLLDEIEMDGYLSKLLNAENRERISELRRRAEVERVSHTSVPATPIPASNHRKNMIAAVDVQQIIREENNWRRSQQGLSLIEDELAQIDGMGGHEFEHWCAELLKKNGFTDVEITKGSGDQGVDIIAVKDTIRYAIQCKCYSSNLGNGPIQEVSAGKSFYHCHLGVVMTNRYFTAGAKKLADANGILLWDRDKLEEMLRPT
ncbi:MAG: restriction endonuclease [Oscillospiraceae bacterium]|nr:restriction endonuclease [Oscillospiraceae bacterium]